MSVGHKRSLTSVYELLANQGVDVIKLKQRIKDCIIKTMISGLPHLTNTYRSCQPQNYAANMCFELLGFDVMLTDKAEPIILEINHTPSFTTDTPLDQFIKFNYIKDSLTIMNINEKTKNQLIKIQKEACQLRVMTGKKVKLTVVERVAGLLIGFLIVDTGFTYYTIFLGRLDPIEIWNISSEQSIYYLYGST